MLNRGNVVPSIFITLKGLDKMTLLDIIKKNKVEFSELDYTIIKYILDNLKDVQYMGIVELGEKVHVSKSTILRLTKKLGFSGFSEFKYYIRHDLLHQNKKQEDLLQMQMKDITTTISYLDKFDFSTLLKKFHDADIVYCYGTGFSQRKSLEGFVAQMMNLNKLVMLIPSKTELDLCMSMITLNDFVMIISLSGETEEVKENLDEFNLRGIQTLSVTAEGDNYFYRHADYALTFCTDTLHIYNDIVKRTAQSFVGLNVVLDYFFRKYIQYIMTLGGDSHVN